MIKLSVTWRDGPQSMSFHAVQTDACMGTIWLIAAVVGTHTLRLPSICTRTQIKAILPTGQLGSLISSVYYSNFQQSLQLIHRKQVIPSQPSDKRNNIICWIAKNLLFIYVIVATCCYQGKKQRLWHLSGWAWLKVVIKVHLTLWMNASRSKAA